MACVGGVRSGRLADDNRGLRINFVAASQYGKTDIEALAFGALAISADVWKATGPVFRRQ